MLPCRCSVASSRRGAYWHRGRTHCTSDRWERRRTSHRCGSDGSRARLSRYGKPLQGTDDLARSSVLTEGSDMATTTPNEFADRLGISPKRLRDWLRATYPRGEHERYAR